MREYRRWLDETCSDCGHPLDECTDPDAWEAYDAEPFVCHACAARERAQQSPEKPDEKGLKWVVRLPDAVRRHLSEKRRAHG